MWLILGSDREAPLFALRTLYHFPVGLGTRIFGPRQVRPLPPPGRRLSQLVYRRQDGGGDADERAAARSTGRGETPIS